MRPINHDGHVVEFDDGTKADIWTIAQDWAKHFEQITSDRCMAPECNETPQPGVVTLWGVPIGRLCEGHMPLRARQPGAWGSRR